MGDQHVHVFDLVEGAGSDARIPVQEFICAWTTVRNPLLHTDIPWGSLNGKKGDDLERP